MKRIKQRVITFMIDSDVDDKVEHLAKRRKMVKKAFLDEAIRAYIEKTDTK